MWTGLKTRSIPSWTTTGFFSNLSSTVNDLVPIYESLTSGSRMTNAEWWFTYDWMPNDWIKVKVTLRLTVSQSVSLGIEPHLELMTRFLLLFDRYGLVFVGRSLWREDGSVFCICYWPLLAQSFSCPESLGTSDHILLFQIWDFPCRRLLRHAGSRWRYSTPPPHGCD
jgi:hypothetical protein